MSSVKEHCRYIVYIYMYVVEGGVQYCIVVCNQCPVSAIQSYTSLHTYVYVYAIVGPCYYPNTVCQRQLMRLQELLFIITCVLICDTLSSLLRFLYLASQGNNVKDVSNLLPRSKVSDHALHGKEERGRGGSGKPSYCHSWLSGWCPAWSGCPARTSVWLAEL